MKKKMTFALCFCNRGFMPGELIYGARDDMVKAVTDAGYDYIMGLQQVFLELLIVFPDAAVGGVHRSGPVVA